MICVTSSNLIIIIVALCFSMLSDGCHGDILLSILKWENEPRQCLRSPSLSHLSPSLTLSRCHWESCQLLFFVSKRSIDALLAPVCSFSIFHCSLERSVAAQTASRVSEAWPKPGLPCSDLQITQKLRSTP